MLLFFSNVIGIPTGCKCDKISIPSIFIDSPELTKYFIKGFADADFCITLKKRYKNYKYYPVINGTSKSKIIVEQIVQFLMKNSFKVSTEFDRIIYDKRFGYTQKSIINLYGHVQLVKWMKTIGFNNLKTISVFEQWKIINKDNIRAKKLLNY